MNYELRLFNSGEYYYFRFPMHCIDSHTPYLFADRVTENINYSDACLLNIYGYAAVTLFDLPFTYQQFPMSEFL